MRKTKKNLKESSDTIAILESTLMNEKIECESVKDKLNSFRYSCENCEKTVVPTANLDNHSLEHIDESMPSTSKCGTCDYKSDDETDLHIHMTSNHLITKIKCDFCELEEKTEEELNAQKLSVHGIKCEHCGETYIGEKKFKTHTCRKHVPNPDYMDLYMKNWFVRNACIPVYSKRLKKEVVLLHTEQCWEKKNFCPEIPLNLDITQKSVLDENGLLHGPIKKSHIIGKDGTICWLGVRGLMLGKMDWYQIIKILQMLLKIRHKQI